MLKFLAEMLNLTIFLILHCKLRSDGGYIATVGYGTICDVIKKHVENQVNKRKKA